MCIRLHQNRRRYIQTMFNVRWLLTYRNKTIKRERYYPFLLFFLEQFQLHFRVTKEDFTKTGLCFLLLHQLQQEKYLVGAYVIHLGHQLIQLKKCCIYRTKNI